MKILLLQDEIYLPSLGGGIKANRKLLEGLAQRGHRCAVVCPALTGAPTGPSNQLQFMQEMAARKTIVRAAEPHVFSFQYNGVNVDALNFQHVEERQKYIIRRIKDFKPDWVLVNEDKRRFLLESAFSAAPDHVVLLLQTIVQLPFGPFTVQENEHQTALMHKSRAIIVISNYLKEYIRRYSGMESSLIPLPVYGDGPFPMLANFDDGFVTMINPCGLKGISIFLALAREFPRVNFAAVPTWGADEVTLRALKETPNMTLLKASDNIQEIFAQTRVLVAPSLWPETFGYVVTEAMLHGLPVLASNVGGLPEAKLGVDYLLPVKPAQLVNNHFVFPPQEIAPWSLALQELLSDRQLYERCAQTSRERATAYVGGITVSAFEDILMGLVTPSHEATTR